jgi:HTH-type transcriptional regulator / antitoxin HigA
MAGTATMDYSHLLSEKHPSVIHNEREHKHLLAELAPLLLKDQLTQAEQRYAELLSVLIEDYEKKTYPLSAKVDPVDALRELMTANGLQQKDLLDVFKHKAVISEVLSRKRSLTVEQIRNLSNRFRVSANVFI